MLFCNIVMIRYVSLKRYAVCSNIASNLKDEIMPANVKFMHRFDRNRGVGSANVKRALVSLVAVISLSHQPPTLQDS